MADAPLRRILAMHRVPPSVMGLAVVASVAGQLLAARQAWPLWAAVLAVLAPWLGIWALGAARTGRRYGWLVLFYVLVAMQTGHLLEHLAQMAQIHALGLTGADAHGVFGALDVEWVHFVWNTGVGVAVLLLLYRFRGNPWLWLAALVAGWHEAEHAYLLAVYLTTGSAGTPGLLARGGAIGGGLPLSRADLHFLYNVIETVPLVIAFVYQFRRSAAAPATDDAGGPPPRQEPQTRGRLAASRSPSTPT